MGAQLDAQLDAPGRTAPAPVSASVQAPQPIPFKQDAPAASVGNSGLAVLLVALAAIGAVLYLRKRLNLPLPGSSGPRLVKVLQSERMGPRALLSVVEFDGKRYLLAQGEHGITCVATGAAPAAGDKA